MPVTNIDIGLMKYKSPVLSSQIVFSCSADTNCTCLVILGVSVIVEDEDFQRGIYWCLASQVEVKRFIEDGLEGVVFDT